MKFDFDDILITPATISAINSRSEVNVLDENQMLPLFTAPMDTVVDDVSSIDFIKNRINTILPRGEHSAKGSFSSDKFQWIAYGLDEFFEVFIRNTPSRPAEKYYALIDIANGNMQKLIDVVKTAGKKYGEQLVLMVGNIANPSTYNLFANLGVEYVRCGVGAGSGCLTSENTGIGYPMASLISECYAIKKQEGWRTKIVADGGMKSYSDIVKSLCLGADFCMLGGIFSKAFESASPLYTKSDFSPLYEEFDFKKYKEKLYEWENETVNPKARETDAELFTGLLITKTFYKKFRGMSTKSVQRQWGKDEVRMRTSEGIETYNKVEYTLGKWCENFRDYLSSAMSYTNSLNLEEFKDSQWELITQNAFKRFNK